MKKYDVVGIGNAVYCSHHVMTGFSKNGIERHHSLSKKIVQFLYNSMGAEQCCRRLSSK